MLTGFGWKLLFVVPGLEFELEIDFEVETRFWWSGREVSMIVDMFDNVAWPGIDRRRCAGAPCIVLESGSMA